MLNNNYELLWSTWIDEEICSNIFDDNCKNGCGYDGNCSYRDDNGNYDYNLMSIIINYDFKMRFDKNDYQYFLIGESCSWYGGFSELKPKMEYRISPLYDSIDDILKEQLHYCDDIRIYKGKYNSLWIEGSHHDGSEVYQICRLNNQGQEMYDKGYNFNFKNHCVKSVFRDFDYFQ